MSKNHRLYRNIFHQYWQQFSKMLGLEQTVSDHFYNMLHCAYTEPQRHYHTMQHIVECLKLFYEIKDQLKDPIAVEWGIWFHDVVYDSQASNNEEKSAELICSNGQGVLKHTELEKVSRWIVATKQHQPTKEHDLKYLLDIDLAILASSTQRFAEYQQQIQQEYSWVNPEIYHVKRAEILMQFYQQQPLFQTVYFHKKFEDVAKNNLGQFLGCL